MRITVLLNTFNNGKYLSDAIKSVLIQTYSNFDFLIIDDGSTDNTKQIINSFSDPRIKFIINDYNIGLGERINQGLKLSNNDFIARMDGDDICFPNRLSKQLKYLKENSKIDILSCQYAELINDRIRYVVKSPFEHCHIRSKLVLHSHILHPGVIYNRNTILKLGGYKNIPIEDFELWLRVKDKLTFGNIPQVLMLKRYHDEAISQQLDIKNKCAYMYLSHYYNNLTSEFDVADKYLFMGWREYFYGDKNKARYYFNKINLKSLSIRLIIAYLFTYLNASCFIKMKDLRLKYVFKYWLTYFNKDNISIRRIKNTLFKLF